MQFEQILATLKQANGEAELQSLLARMTLQPIETYKNSIQNQVKFTHEIVVLSHAFNNELDLLFEYIVQDARVFKRFADDSYKIKIINSLFPGKNFVLLGCIVKLGYLLEAQLFDNYGAPKNLDRN